MTGPKPVVLPITPPGIRSPAALFAAKRRCRTAFGTACRIRRSFASISRTADPLGGLSRAAAKHRRAHYGRFVRAPHASRQVLRQRPRAGNVADRQARGQPGQVNVAVGVEVAIARQGVGFTIGPKVFSAIENLSNRGFAALAAPSSDRLGRRASEPACHQAGFASAAPTAAECNGFPWGRGQLVRAHTR